MKRRGIVLSKVGGRYRVFCSGSALDAALRGRLKQESAEQLLVGDVVTTESHPDGSVTIEEVHPRRSLLKRRAPGRSHGERHVAANIDQVVVVGAARQPDWDHHLIDRFTTVGSANGLAIVVVVNKCDLIESAADCGAPYEAAGYPVVYTSVPEHRGLEPLHELLRSRVSLFTGPTGVGKSSLLNALQPGLRLRTGVVGQRSRSGKHTTVAAEMHPLGGDGFVVDTPGLRDIGLWGLEPQDVAAVFPEFARWAADCRFDNCRHLQEPGCAVIAAVDLGALAGTRLASYRQMLDEAYQAARPWRQGGMK